MLSPAAFPIGDWDGMNRAREEVGAPEIALPTDRSSAPHLPAHHGEGPLPGTFWKRAAVHRREEAQAGTRVSPQRSKAHANIDEFPLAPFCVD